MQDTKMYDFITGLSAVASYRGGPSVAVTRLRERWSKGETALACWLHAADELTVEVLAQVVG